MVRTHTRIAGWCLRVILTGVTSGWGAVDRWQKGELLRLYGDSRIEVGEASEIIAFDGKGSMYSTLRDFVGGFGRRPAAGGRVEDHFVFDSSEILEHGQSQMLADFATPEQFKGFMGTGVRDSDRQPASSGWHMLSIGDDEKGLHFHSHGDSWLALVHGAKRWLLYPPGRAPQEVFESLSPISPSMHDWKDKTLPKLQQDGQLVDCVQESGEAMVACSVSAFSPIHMRIDSHETPLGSFRAENSGVSRCSTCRLDGCTRRSTSARPSVSAARPPGMPPTGQPSRPLGFRPPAVPLTPHALPSPSPPPARATGTPKACLA